MQQKVKMSIKKHILYALQLSTSWITQQDVKKQTLSTKNAAVILKYEQVIIIVIIIVIKYYRNSR